MNTGNETLSNRDLAAEIAALAGRLHDVQYRMVILVGEYDRRGAWAATGATSCANWLAGIADIDIATAREHIRIARSLTDLPATCAAFETGELSYAKVRVLTRIAEPDTELELIALAATCTANDLAKAIAS